MKHAIASTALLAIVLTGCKSAPPPVVLPPSAPVFTVPAARADSSAALVDRNAQLSSTIAELPGDSLEEHRTLLVTTLGHLSKSLQLANGPVNSPAFNSRIAVIDAAQATASITDLPRARMEAVENQALQAAEAAIAEIKTRYLYDDDQLPALIDTVNTDVSKASDTVGPLHDVDATHAFRSIENVIQRISDDMTERFGGGTPPPPAPPAPTP